jgi:hypothetical protein
MDLSPEILRGVIYFVEKIHGSRQNSLTISSEKKIIGELTDVFDQLLCP